MEGRADLGRREGEEGREGNGASLPRWGGDGTKEGDPGKIKRGNSLAPAFLTESSKKKKH